MSTDYEVKKYTKKSNKLSGRNTDWEKYKKGIMSRYEEIKEIGKDNVLMEYDRLCEVMKEEVCRASGKRYKKNTIEGKGHNSDISSKEVNNGKIENRESKRQQVEWWDKDCEEAVRKRKKC